LLPVELILQVASSAGFAMVFALLTAAILWNLRTWFFGLPSSSSHTLIRSIVGVGLANQIMATTTATSGVDWAQARNIGKSLLISPLVGLTAAGLLLLLAKVIIPDKRLYQARRADGVEIVATLVYTNHVDDRAKLFKSGGSQAVRLPKSYRFAAQREVRIRREGQRVILEPIRRVWSNRFLALAGTAPDFKRPPEPKPAEEPPDLD
jgi:phosphate/sulfate permease